MDHIEVVYSTLSEKEQEWAIFYMKGLRRLGFNEDDVTRKTNNKILAMSAGF